MLRTSEIIPAYTRAQRTPDAKDIPFQHICCIDERRPYADISKIGKESAPWYCSERNVYVEFQFVAPERHDSVSTPLLTP
jgi:hypothetical protein